MNARFPALFAALAVALLAALAGAGCNVQSANDVVRSLPFDFTGFYANSNGRIIDRNTGAPVTALNLRQNGDRLEAVDNNGRIFRGSLNEAGDNTAQFNLRGSTTAGVEGTLTGTLSGNGTTGTLRGTWIEASIIANAFATATISPGSTNTTGNLVMTPSGSITMTVNATRSFTASGGSGTYTWAVANSALGALSATSGANVTYNARAAGTQTLTLSDGRNTPVTATITQSTGVTIQ